jgi:maleylpyruvate isomerase
MTVRDWFDEGTALFLDALDGLDDKELDAPSLLPGWSRRHLVGHVHYNAEALRRLVRWAATGERTPMYESAGQRTAEIEAGAQLPPERLRRLVRESAAALSADLDALTNWDAEVVTAQGRTVPATEIPWMRTREVAVHAIDLGTGLSFRDLPDALNTALVADVVAKRSANGEAAELAAWLTGRTAEAPTLGPWL